ncbi:MAG: nicotinate phosphoribosyltransferase, partial [Cyanobacteria bacterium J06639_1]
VIRPDSGNPPVVVNRILHLLDDRFGSTLNAKGYKVLNSVRIIQGDGMNPRMVERVLDDISKSGFSTSNVAFGMGGALLQQVNRDTQKFAYKCSSVTVNGQERDVFKDPATDPGKRSKAGRLDLVKEGDRYLTVKLDNQQTHPESQLATVYENGTLLREYSLDAVRALALS